jgi:hypothetical protein
VKSDSVEEGADTSTARQERMIVALLEHSSQEKAAAALGISTGDAVARNAEAGVSGSLS